MAPAWDSDPPRCVYSIRIAGNDVGLAGASLAVYGETRRSALGAGLASAGLLLTTRAISNTDFPHLASQAREQLHLGGGTETNMQPTA